MNNKFFRLLVVVTVFISLSGHAQNTSDKINIQNINFKYLEYLIKNEIDHVRLELGFPKLINDSILYMASKDHVNYLDKNGLLTHYQSNSSSKQTPQFRAEYFGAKNYQVGENIVQIPLHQTLLSNDNLVETITYLEAAITIRKLWVNSPTHYANIATINYDITGLAIQYNKKDNTLRCVQNFALINNLYIYKKDSILFPYAEEIPKQYLQNFEPTYGKRHKKHAYGIKETKKNKICKDNRTAIFNVHTISITIKNDSLYLGIRKGSLSRIKSYFKDKHDGLSIEIVLFKYNYSCNLCDNYVVATRRNGRCEFDGYVTPPLFKDAVLDSIQKTMDYLKAQRIHLDKEENLLINLGQFPKMAEGERINANVIIYSKKRVCKVIEGISLCGTPMSNALPELPITSNYDPMNYKPGISTKVVHFKVGFEQNSTEINQKVIDEKIVELKDSDTEVLKAKMEAYASVEGSPEINEKLFRKRAALILQRFEEVQEDSINFKLTTTENWKMFFNQIKSTEYEFLGDWDTNEIRKYINIPQNVVKLEPLLKKERYVYAKLYIRPILNPFTRVAFAHSEFDTLVKRDNGKWNKKTVKRLLQIQNYLFNEVAQKNLDYNALSLPDVSEPSLHYNRILFDYQYASSKMNNSTLTSELKKLVLLKYFSPPSLKINYFISSINSGEFVKFKEKQSRLKSVISHLKQKKHDSIIIEEFTRRLHHNYVNNYYNGHGGNYATVKNAKSYLHHYFTSKSSQYDDDYKFRIAKYYIFMSEVDWAMPILKELALKPNYKHAHYQLYIQSYYYMRSFSPKYFDYELKIIDSTEKLTNLEWCDMFIGGCNISIPIFDNQAIKYLYCEKCR